MISGIRIYKKKDEERINRMMVQGFGRKKDTNSHLYSTDSVKTMNCGIDYLYSLLLCIYTLFYFFSEILPYCPGDFLQSCGFILSCDFGVVFFVLIMGWFL